MPIRKHQNKRNRGMSYVELIVVLSIFSVMSSVVIYNYGGFQAKVDIKNLSNDIGLKVVEAQKSSLSGKLPARSYDSSWKPSYGVYIDQTTDNKSFIYFTDLDQNKFLADPSCTGISECLDKITITKNNYISRVDSYLNSTPTLMTNPLSITFKRPDSSAVFGSNGLLLTGFDYIQITILSPKGPTAKIKVYPSGRIQVN